MMIASLVGFIDLSVLLLIVLQSNAKISKTYRFKNFNCIASKFYDGFVSDKSF